MRPILVLSLAAAAACAPDPELLFERGPDAVGYKTVQITVPSPIDEERTIPVDIWYPAEDTGNAAIYEVAGVVRVPSDVALAAPPPLPGMHPVALYSHGSGGEALLGYPFGEHLASHGWIVVSPAHVGNTAIDYVEGEGRLFVENIVHRPLDVTATLDALEGGLGDDPLVGLGDTERVLVIGHSFGGWTALAVAGGTYDVDRWADVCAAPDAPDDCAILAEPAVEAQLRAGFADPRVAAIVPQAPALFDAGGLDALGVPSLLQTGKRDQTTPWETDGKPTWDLLAHPGDVWVDIPDGGHYTFISICDDLTPAVRNLFRPGSDEDGCGEDFLPVSDALPLLTAYIDGFGRQHILGERGWDSVLAGEPLGAGVELTTR